MGKPDSPQKAQIHKGWDSGDLDWWDGPSATTTSPGRSPLHEDKTFSINSVRVCSKRSG
jgi:hypothetical protein